MSRSRPTHGFVEEYRLGMGKTHSVDVLLNVGTRTSMRGSFIAS